MIRRVLPALVVVSLLMRGGYAAASDSVNRARQTGDVLQYAMPGAALGLTLLFQDYRGLTQFAVGAALNQGATQLMKATISAPRPNGKDERSMPSGHTSTAFQAAGFAQRRYGWAAGVPFLLAASFTGYSRVVSDWHYPRDVVAGAALGLACSYVTTTRLNGRIRLLPWAGPGMYGLRIQRPF